MFVKKYKEDECTTPEFYSRFYGYRKSLGDTWLLFETQRPGEKPLERKKTLQNTS